MGRRPASVSSRARARPATRTPPRRPPGRRGRWIGLSLIALVVVVGGVVGGLVATSGGSGGEGAISRAGSVRVPGPGGYLPVTQPPAEYSITYREDDYAGKPTVTTTVTLSVARPFESVYETRAGAPPGGKVESTYVNSLGLYSAAAAGTSSTVTALMPQTASEDFRLDASLPDLIARGVLVPRERRRVLGSVCEVYRTNQPLGSSTLSGPGRNDYADECIDARGLLLEEVWVSKGKVLSRKLATRLDTHPAFPPSEFAISTKSLLPLTSGGGKLVQLTATSRPATNFWKAPAPPAGFVHRGLYLFAQGSASPGAAGAATFSAVDLYTDGSDYVALVQGNVGDLPSSSFTNPLARNVSAGRLPGAQAVPGPFDNTVQSKLDSFRYLQVVGTLPMSALTQFAASLRPAPPGKVSVVPISGTG